PAEVDSYAVQMSQILNSPTFTNATLTIPGGPFTLEYALQINDYLADETLRAWFMNEWTTLAKTQYNSITVP
ncbi:MAG: hypothetical protein ACXADS_14540, partial [Candidatus Thorarchaeota archaeon]